MRRFRIVRKDTERVIGEGCVLSDGRVIAAALTVQMEPMLYKTAQKLLEDWGLRCVLEFLDGQEVVN